MKKNNSIIYLSIIALIAVLGFMAYDFFSASESNENPYEYNLDQWLHVDPNLISHEEILKIKVDIEILRAIGLDRNDAIYVSGKDKLLIYDAFGKLQKEVPTQIEAFSMAISEEGNIYLSSRNSIQVYNLQGELLDKWNTHIENAILTSVAVDEQNLYLADAANKIVYRYNLQGEFLNEIGRKDPDIGIEGFIIPSPYFDLAIGREGELWVVNSGRHQLESYSPEGQLKYSWKKSSMGLEGFSGCCNPSHIALLSNGSFVSSEKGIERIKISNPSGAFESVVAPPTAFKKGTRGIDLVVDSKDRILAIDPEKKEIIIYQRKGD